MGERLFNPVGKFKNFNEGNAIKIKGYMRGYGIPTILETKLSNLNRLDNREPPIDKIRTLDPGEELYGIILKKWNIIRNDSIGSFVETVYMAAMCKDCVVILRESDFFYGVEIKKVMND